MRLVYCTLHIHQSVEARVQSQGIHVICSRKPQQGYARRLAEVTGRIISMRKAIGSAVYLYTRQMYLAIETRASWDSFISFSPRVINELQFWHNNVSQLNGQSGTRTRDRRIASPTR